MMKMTGLALGLALLTASAQAAQEWTVDNAHSTLGFTALQGEDKVEGSFKKFAASIRFSPDDLTNSAIKVTIETGSATAGAADRDEALPGSAWFNVAQFPQAQFVSKSIKATGPNAYVADATLNIRGISKDVQLPFTLSEEGGKTHATGKLVVQRNDYGVGQGEFASDGWIKFPVTVTVDIWAVPMNKPL